MKLYKISEDLFRLDGKRLSKKELLSQCDDLGIEFVELAQALKEMTAKGHDEADFGLNGNFIFSKKSIP